VIREPALPDAPMTAIFMEGSLAIRGCGIHW
jgi:hypothetical protein